MNKTIPEDFIIFDEENGEQEEESDQLLEYEVSQEEEANVNEGNTTSMSSNTTIQIEDNWNEQTNSTSEKEEIG